LKRGSKKINFQELTIPYIKSGYQIIQLKGKFECIIPITAIKPKNCTFKRRGTIPLQFVTVYENLVTIVNFSGGEMEIGKASCSKKDITVNGKSLYSKTCKSIVQSVFTVSLVQGLGFEEEIILDKYLSSFSVAILQNVFAGKTFEIQEVQNFSRTAMSRSKIGTKFRRLPDDPAEPVQVILKHFETQEPHHFAYH